MIRYDHPTREAFEAWLRGTSGFKRCAQRGKPMWFTQLMDGTYRDFRVNDRWFAWRAALQSVASAESCLCAAPDPMCMDCGGTGRTP